MCNFCFKADTNKTAIVSNLCASSATSYSARACERCKAFGVIVNLSGNRALKFERRSRAVNRGDREREKLSGRGGVLAEHLFSTLF